MPSGKPSKRIWKPYSVWPLQPSTKTRRGGVHIQRLGHYSALLARNLGLSSNEIDIIFHAYPMHDVGKLGIPDENLLKPGKLDPGEWDIMKKHTTIGGRLLSGSSSELLQAGEIIALSHHERWDGKGYPKGIAEEEIPLSGRICAVSDVFDALTSNRPYKKAYSKMTLTKYCGKEGVPTLTRE